MRKRITTSKHLAAAMARHALMVTHGPAGKDYATTNGVGVSAKLAKGLLECSDSVAPQQADLFLIPNDDGLFPGFSQTWTLI